MGFTNKDYQKLINTGVCSPLFGDTYIKQDASNSSPNWDEIPTKAYTATRTTITEFVRAHYRNIPKTNELYDQIKTVFRLQANTSNSIVDKILNGENSHVDSFETRTFKEWLRKAELGERVITSSNSALAFLEILRKYIELKEGITSSSVTVHRKLPKWIEGGWLCYHIKSQDVEATLEVNQDLLIIKNDNKPNVTYYSTYRKSRSLWELSTSDDIIYIDKNESTVGMNLHIKDNSNKVFNIMVKGDDHSDIITATYNIITDARTYNGNPSSGILLMFRLDDSNLHDNSALDRDYIDKYCRTIDIRKPYTLPDNIKGIDAQNFHKCLFELFMLQPSKLIGKNYTDSEDALWSANEIKKVSEKLLELSIDTLHYHTRAETEDKNIHDALLKFRESWITSISRIVQNAISRDILSIFLHSKSSVNITQFYKNLVEGGTKELPKEFYVITSPNSSYMWSSASKILNLIKNEVEQKRIFMNRIFVVSKQDVFRFEGNNESLEILLKDKDVKQLYSMLKKSSKDIIDEHYQSYGSLSTNKKFDNKILLISEFQYIAAMEDLFKSVKYYGIETSSSLNWEFFHEINDSNKMNIYRIDCKVLDNERHGGLMSMTRQLFEKYSDYNVSVLYEDENQKI